jgi:hypothetical protein
MVGNRLLGAGVVCAALLACGVARGAPEDQKQRADQLYQDGRAAFAAGDYEKACPLLASYYELDSSAGALFTLAECEARWGKPVRAVAHFEQFLWQTQSADQTSVQQQRIQMANDELRRFSQQVSHVLPRPPPGTKGLITVKIDGAPVTLPVPRALVLEPGEHSLDEDGAPPRHVTFLLAPGETKVLTVGATSPPSTSAEHAPVASGTSGTPTQEQPPPEQPSRFTAPVIALGAIGVAGIVTGSITGALAFSAKSDADAHCVSYVCDHTGKQAADRGQTMATVSTVAFIVGAVALAGGVALYLYQPSAQSRASVFIAPGVAGGTF